MNKDLIIGRRVLKNGLVLATTLLTCAGLQANEHEDQTPQNAGAPPSTERNNANSTAHQGDRQQQEKFVRKALTGGKMEVRMGQLARQNGGSQEVKALGQALVQDHGKANQQLQQIAQRLNISTTERQDHEQNAAGQQAGHGKPMDRLKGMQGAEFDKEFAKMAVKHHRKDIAEFERAQQQVQDPQLKSFIQQTLPTLRQHLQMAQMAARMAGVDAAALNADDDGTAAGAPGASQSESLEQPSNESKPQGSIRNDDIDVDVDRDNGGKIFQKGDGKVLGLPTSNTDGKYLGIIPAPGSKKHNDTDVSVDADAEPDRSVGAPADAESGTSSDRDVKVDVDVEK